MCAVPVIKNSFVLGEMSPELWGRTDIERYSGGCSTARNMYVNYRGGIDSRAGTSFVGYSKQTGQALPPRLITFQFSINQGLALEFGDQYMRVISDGALVTKVAGNIDGITNANPAIVTVGVTGVDTASANTSLVVSSYAPGDFITLAGGIYTVPGTLEVITAGIFGVQVNAPGSGYAPGNTIVPAGGVQTTAAQLTVLTTQIGAIPTIVSAGTGGTDGTATLTGTTGTGTKFQVNATISGGAITAINFIVSNGDYTVNPATPASEPVTGGALTGAVLGIEMGARTVSVTAPGVFTANPVGGIFSQTSTSGSGTGASFYFAIMKPIGVVVTNPGIYTSFPANPVSQASTTGSGIGATYDITTSATFPFVTGQWVYIEAVEGITQVNNRTFVIGTIAGANFQLLDVFGNTIDSTGYGTYAGGGTAATIFELETPYSAADLPYLKVTESADVMSLCCWNQETLSEYAPMDLTRLADNDWTILPSQFGAVVSSVSNLHVVPRGGNTEGQQYAIYYYVTAVDNATGEESVPQQCVTLNGALGASSTSSQVFSNTVIWAAVRGDISYNVYAETAVPQLGSNGNDLLPPPTFIAGLIGTTLSVSFTDTNIAPDFTKSPPQHQDPFAPGAIVSALVTSGGTGYNAPLVTSAVVTSATGYGSILTPIYVGQGAYIGNVYVQNGGQDYEQGNTVAIVGGGSGATATLTIGPETGTYPGVVAYFQERRVFASTQNNPDTYWMSKPGLYLNFDTSFPSVATDAITGSPWAIEVNGIQWLVNMPGGLVVLTGLGAWQLTGAGGSSLNPVPITPAAQQAQPQAFNGVSATVPPIKIDYQIIYVQAKGSIVREFSYQFFQNIYTGVDLTEFSSQLFSGFTIDEWAYTEEPAKIIWAVRNDGILLSLTYLKAEQVQGWARHDTNGSYVSVCSVTEPPVDALYLVTKRQIAGINSYMLERMDDRDWQTAEQSWCVDAGLTTAPEYPEATVTTAAPVGVGSITGVSDLVGGAGYSAATYATINDNNGLGLGSGAVPVLTIVAGVITSIAFSSQGSTYTSPSISFTDPAGSDGGSGASATCVLNNGVTISADAPVFSAGSVGSIIRAFGGIAEVTGFLNSQAVTANVLLPFTKIIPDSGSQTSWPGVYPSPAGSWTLAAPITTVEGLYHLIGATVTGVADGNVISPRPVQSDGTIALDAPASLITVGLGFTAQVQSVYFDGGQGAVSQGRRKRIAGATCRMNLSRDIAVGTNQPDGSALSPIQVAPAWSGLTALPNLRPPSFNALCEPLFTGDVRIPVPGNLDTRGQLALQQSNPLPMSVTAIIPEIVEGDVEAGKTGAQPAGGGNGSADAGFYFNSYPAGSISFSGPPTSGTVAVPITFMGNVLPENAPVEISFSTSSNTPPASGWSDATVSGNSWTGTATPITEG